MNQLGLFKSGINNEARSLGVVFDAELKSDKHINRFMSFKGLEVVVHAFITSRLDYCNSLPHYEACSLSIVLLLGF